ncbi:efflux RND transporter periplasmic adaptor subunit [uncultured Alistipes sp.]|uniref:efflux RND transporter periplasmic adaptor subunit n=1 Tax=uncultured Alistipes sp. TaxID=538949 RepID=UPI0026325230|nr:efflux RND transporter periplasmic adaptor subunit [uncultured Alistipes sp.]
MKRTAAICLALLGLAACGSKQQTTQVVETPRVLTKTATAERAVVQLTEEYTSEILPYKENDITPAASGVHIDRIRVDVGDRVQQGQVLVTLDPTQYNQALVQLKTVEDDYNRLKPVFDAGGISAQQIDQAKAALDVQREVVANLKKNIELRSPITGVVTARNNEAGDLFMNQPILHVMQINPVKVIANIPEQFFPAVKVGMPVDLKLEVFPDRTFAGRVSLIHPALDAATRTFTVEVTVPNGGEVLRPGMFARTIFNMGEKEGVMVPDVAVQKQVGSSERYLYVIKDGKAERRRVTQGRQSGSRIDILSGVEEGEAVAVTAFSRLDDGVEVEIAE